MPEIKVLALQSPQIIINELAADFEQRAGYKITQLLRLTDMPIHIKQKTDAGEVFDAAFVVPAVLDQLEKEGKIIGNSRTNFLRIPIGVAVRTGSAKPDISSVEAFKRTLLEAKSIAYLRAGTSGPYLQGLFERFGIAAEMQSKAKRTETDTVGELVAARRSRNWRNGNRDPNRHPWRGHCRPAPTGDPILCLLCGSHQH